MKLTIALLGIAAVSLLVGYVVAYVRKADWNDEWDVKKVEKPLDVNPD